MLAPGANQTPPANLNALAQDEALLSLFQRQERVQEKLLETQARLEQQDARLATTTSSNAVTPLAQMAAPSPPRAPLIVGGPQSEEYISVGLHHGLHVWAYADIVKSSVGDFAETGSPLGGQ